MKRWPKRIWLVSDGGDTWVIRTTVAELWEPHQRREYVLAPVKRRKRKVKQ